MTRPSRPPSLAAASTRILPTGRNQPTTTPTVMAVAPAVGGATSADDWCVVVPARARCRKAPYMPFGARWGRGGRRRSVLTFGAAAGGAVGRSDCRILGVREGERLTAKREDAGKIPGSSDPRPSVNTGHWSAAAACWRSSTLERRRHTACLIESCERECPGCRKRSRSDSELRRFSPRSAHAPRAAHREVRGVGERLLNEPSRPADGPPRLAAAAPRDRRSRPASQMAVLQRGTGSLRCGGPVFGAHTWARGGSG